MVKTGMHRQSDLVRLLASTAPLGKPSRQSLPESRVEGGDQGPSRYSSAVRLPVVINLRGHSGIERDVAGGCDVRWIDLDLREVVGGPERSSVS